MNISISKVYHIYKFSVFQILKVWFLTYCLYVCMYVCMYCHVLALHGVSIRNWIY
jgi:hypothetical protein